MGPESTFWFDANRLATRRVAGVSALWKIIACPQPLSVLIAHGQREYDGISNGIHGAPANWT